MSKKYNFKEMCNSMNMLSCDTLFGIEYLCYLFHIHDLGWENRIDNPPPNLIISSVLVHAGCCYKMPKAGWFINHIICHCSGG